MQKQKSVKINVAGDEINLSAEHINFYRSETRKNIVKKNSVEKFYNNLIEHFTVKRTRD